jgi:Ion channel inhibitory toxin
MNKQKLSLAAIQDKLSRNEMKQIMAGSGRRQQCVERWGICNATQLCCEGLTCSSGNGTNHCGI